MERRASQRVLLLVLTSTAASATARAAPSLHVEAPPSLEAALLQELRGERPQLELTSVDEADVRVKLEVRAGEHVLALADRGTSQERRLGANASAAIRLAVLLVVRALDEVEVAPAVSSTAAAAPRPVVPSAPLSPPASTERRAPWGRVDAGFGAVAWTGPWTARLGGELAAVIVLDPVELGVRFVATGLCCALSRDNLDATTTLLAPFFEARYQMWGNSSVQIMATGAVGAVFESVSAQVVDLFSGPTVVEQQNRVDVAGRLGIVSIFPIFKGLDVRLAGGAQLHGRAYSVRLPASFAGGRAPLSRGVAVPYANLSLGASFF